MPRWSGLPRLTVCQYVSMSICQHVNMSICQYVRMQLFSLVIKMKVVQNVKTISENIISVCQHVSMSVCQYVRMSICQHVSMSICQYVRMQLFSLGIKMRIVPNVIRRKLWKSLSVRESERKSEIERVTERDRVTERIELCRPTQLNYKLVNLNTIPAQSLHNKLFRWHFAFNTYLTSLCPQKEIPDFRTAITEIPVRR